MRNILKAVLNIKTLTIPHEVSVSSLVVQRTKLGEGSLLGIIQLSALDDDSVRGQVDPPGQGGRAAQHLEQALPKEALHQVAIRPQHASMVDADARVKQLLQLPAHPPPLSSETCPMHVLKRQGRTEEGVGGA